MLRVQVGTAGCGGAGRPDRAGSASPIPWKWRRGTACTFPNPQRFWSRVTIPLSSPSARRAPSPGRGKLCGTWPERSSWQSQGLYISRNKMHGGFQTGSLSPPQKASKRLGSPLLFSTSLLGLGRGREGPEDPGEGWSQHTRGRARSLAGLQSWAEGRRRTCLGSRARF